MRRISLLVIALAMLALAQTACGRIASSSPTETLKAFNKAMQTKDVAAIKKTLSKHSLQIIEVEAHLRDDQTLDDAIRTGLEKVPPDLKLPEMRNEKIKGDTAAVEVKDEQKRLWFPVSFVREDGQWKIAYDKAMRDPSHKMRGKPFVDAMPEQ